MRLIFQDQTFSFELLRTLSYAPYGGADIGECLSTAYRIKEGDFESWYTEWYRTAERIHALAVDSLERGKRSVPASAICEPIITIGLRNFFSAWKSERPAYLGNMGEKPEYVSPSY